MTDPDQVRADFDRIARLGAERADVAGDYDDLLLDLVPAPCRRALDVGCGDGGFARRLAERADHVTGLDLSPEMIRVARARSTNRVGLDFAVADFTTWSAPDRAYDCVSAIHALHHMPFEAALARLARLVRPGGVLIVHDLFRMAGPVDWAAGAVAVPVAAVTRRRRPAATPPSPALRAAWAEHGAHDELMTLPELRRRAAAVLPGASLRRHLLWRYTLLWRG